MGVILEDCGPQLHFEDISNVVGDFPTANYFYNFYLKYNGGALPQMFVINREKISSLKLNQILSISDFYKIETANQDVDYSIQNNLKLKRKLYTCIDKTYPSAFPFARDMGDNEFWLNRINGHILYFPFDYGDNFCSEIDVVCHSFEEFINSLESGDDYEE